MSLLISFVFLQLLVSYINHADSQTQDYISSSGDGKLPSKCERYAGNVCSKFVGNQFVYVKPLQAQAQKETQMKILFSVLPDYISKKCQPYALQALCLSAFPPCDLTVNYPKPRMFCQDECRMLEEYICEDEFTSARAKYMASLVPPCSSLPSAGSPEHKKCVRLNLTVANPEFKVKLRNKTVQAGETVVLKCKLKATDIPPSITWYKDGKIIQHGHAFYKIHLFRDSSRMKIRRIKVGDAGKYTCHASNFNKNVSTHSWITVIAQNKSTLAPVTKGNSRCGHLGSDSICRTYLKNKKVYFYDPKKQNERELQIKKALSKHNLSPECYKLATEALCYETFPACGKGNSKKHRLCKEDCLRVRRNVCKNRLPKIFPICSHLPRRTGRRGKHCNSIDTSSNVNSMCGKYKGNGFCGKYIKNETVYLYDPSQQYRLEQTISVSLKGIPISEKCLRYGIPALCYHLFSVCSHGKKRSRLCQGECTKLKTDVCSSEVSFIKKVSIEHLRSLFPECSKLPRINTKEGAQCVPLGIPPTFNTPQSNTKHPPRNNESILQITKEHVDVSHNCYNTTGEDYLGTANITVFHNVCISWMIRRPKLGWHHNYCRNPDKDVNSTWCYVNKEGRREYCAVKKCKALSKELYNPTGEGTSLGRTIYVVIAIVAVILLGCITVIVYWKVQNSKENVDNSPQNSAAPFAKCSSTQLTDVRENTSVQSFVLNEKLTRGRVKYVSVISEGRFFRVFKGILINDQDKPNMDIVIKTLSEDATKMEKEFFRRETSLLCPLQHMNILGLLGISPGEGTEFVVFEYLSEINLHQYLKRAHNNGKNLPTDILSHIACQIADGMKYLSEFSYVHGDLATRNCFIADENSNLTVKISLLGIGSHKYPSDYDWLQQRNALFPIRWMSPEALESLLLTSENDVWSFGVLLWELFSHGLKPYQQCSNSGATDKIRALELLECPDDCPQGIRNVMQICWTIAPSSRPNFVTVYDMLSS